MLNIGAYSDTYTSIGATLQGKFACPFVCGKKKIDLNHHQLDLLYTIIKLFEHAHNYIQVVH